MMVSKQFSYREYVKQTPGVKSNSPCVAGTGLRVIHVLRLYRDRGLTPREIAAELDVSLPAVHGALAFALENEQALDQAEQERESWVDEFAVKGPGISG